MSTTVRSSVKAQVFGAQNVTETLKPPTLSNRIQALSEEAEDTDVLGDIEIKIEKDGKVLQYGKHPMKSLVANYINLLYGLINSVGGYTGSSGTSTVAPSVVKPDGTSTNTYTEWYSTVGSASFYYYYYGGGTPMGCFAPANDSSYGIVVGSGTNAVVISDYKLGSQITNGTGSGQLVYGQHTLVGPTVDTTNNKAYFSFVRSFVNRSGSTITVSECGIIARNYWKDGGGVRQDVKYLIIRDLINPPIQVPNTATLTITYYFEVSLS